MANDPVSGNTPLTQPENRAFYPALDGLRAIAFLMVFVWHYADVPWMWAGVDVFFVISGFLITGILYDTRNDKHRARNFYVRRTLRIFPLYYGVLLLLFLLTPVFHWRWSPLWLCWPLYVANWLYLANAPVNSTLSRAKFGSLQGTFLGHDVIARLGHFWSLCAEEQFYLLWPWVVFRIRSRRVVMGICIGVGLACVALRRVAPIFFPSLVPKDALPHVTLFRFDSLLVGGLVALLLRGPSAQWWLRLGRWLWTPCFLAAFAWAFLLPSHFLKWHFYVYPSWLNKEGFLLLELLSALLVLNLVEGSSRWNAVLQWKPLRFLGRLSYGLYVFHDIFHGLYDRAGIAGRYNLRLAMVSCTALAGTILLAWLSFRFFETPFLNLKERFTVRDAA